MEAWLQSNSGKKIPVQGTCVIGRSSKNTIPVPDDPLVSRRHALVHQQESGHFWLVDLGSSNGVLLNGRRVHQPVALKDQDRIEVGSNLFVFLQTQTAANASDTSMLKSDHCVTMKSVKTQQLWLLMADIEGFTPLSQKLPGDELAKLVGAWICECKEVIEQNEGVINKYLGDGFLVYWPNPGTEPGKVAHAVGELKKLAQQIQKFSFRLVIHKGDITVDNGLSAGESSLIGPDVNFLFRMEKVAAGLRERCVISASAAEHLNAFSTVRSVGLHPLSGFGGKHEFFAF